MVLDPVERQHVIFVGATTPYGDTSRMLEAVEVVFDVNDGIPPDELASKAASLILPTEMDWSDRRFQGRWGASGPVIQEVLIAYSIGVASGVSASLITDGLKKLSKRWSSRPVVERSSAETAEEAWFLFESFLRRAFNANSAEVLDIRSASDEWWMAAVTPEGFQYEGTVSLDGRILNARLVKRVSHFG